MFWFPSASQSIEVLHQFNMPIQQETSHESQIQIINKNSHPPQHSHCLSIFLFLTLPSSNSVLISMIHSEWFGMYVYTTPPSFNHSPESSTLLGTTRLHLCSFRPSWSWWKDRIFQIHKVFIMVCHVSNTYLLWPSTRYIHTYWRQNKCWKIYMNFFFFGRPWHQIQSKMVNLRTACRIWAQKKLHLMSSCHDTSQKLGN